MLQDPPCRWTRGPWVRTSPPQSDLLGASLHLLLTAQQPPTLGHPPPTPRALHLAGQKLWGADNCTAMKKMRNEPWRCPPHCLPNLFQHSPVAGSPQHLHFLSLLLQRRGIAAVTHGQSRIYKKKHRKIRFLLFSTINPIPRVQPPHGYTRPVQAATSYRALIYQSPIQAPRWGCSPPRNTTTWRRSWLGLKSQVVLLKQDDNFSCVWLPKV